MSSKAVVITGAGGFIGSHLVDRCLGLGWRVTGVDAFTDYYDESLKRGNLAGAADHPEFSLVEGDLLELELAPILNGATTMFHLAAQPGVRTSWDAFELYVRQNVRVTQRLLHAARELPLERFVVASSSSIYGDAETMPTSEDLAPQPVSPYGVTKVATEHLARLYWRNFGVPAVSLRYFTVYGPRQRPDMAFNRLISAAVADRPFEVFGDGEQSRDFTFVTDAVSGTVAAAQVGAPGGAYNIGGGSRRTMNSVFDTLEELTGSSVRRAYQDRQLGDARDTAADIGRARRDLGFEPTFDFAAGLWAQLEWQQATLAKAQAAP
jgi:nucleoside-diphosphate-sugar epimerase